MWLGLICDCRLSLKLNLILHEKGVLTIHSFCRCLLTALLHVCLASVSVFRLNKTGCGLSPFLVSELPKENTSPGRYWTKMSSKQIHPGFCLLPAVWFCSLHSFLLGTMLVRKLKTHTPNKKRKLKTTQCPFVCSFVTVETYQFCFSFEHTNCLCQGLGPKLSSYTAAWYYPSRGWLFQKRKLCGCNQCSS